MVLAGILAHQPVDHRDHRAQREATGDGLVGQQQLDHGHRVGEAGCLDQHAIEPVLGAVVPAGIEVEQPRGELLYYLKGKGEKTLDRVRIRTPTFANLPPLLVMLPGMYLSDVPVVTLSIDPCISCTER
jgi:NADH:ubiquinone oxidoreductase subunit D